MNFLLQLLELCPRHLSGRDVRLHFGCAGDGLRSRVIQLALRSLGLPDDRRQSLGSLVARVLRRLCDGLQLCDFHRDCRATVSSGAPRTGWLWSSRVGLGWRCSRCAPRTRFGHPPRSALRMRIDVHDDYFARYWAGEVYPSLFPALGFLALCICRP